MSTTIETLCENARRMRKESHHVAWAASFVGIRARSLCCDCAERLSPIGFAVRLPLGGECEACPYVGHDCLVTVEEPAEK